MKTLGLIKNKLHSYFIFISFIHPKTLKVDFCLYNRSISIIQLFNRSIQLFNNYFNSTKIQFFFQVGYCAALLTVVPMHH